LIKISFFKLRKIVFHIKEWFRIKFAKATVNSLLSAAFKTIVVILNHRTASVNRMMQSLKNVTFALQLRRIYVGRLHQRNWRGAR